VKAEPSDIATATAALSIGGEDLQTILTRDAGNPVQANADAAAVIGNIATFVGDLAARGVRNFDVLNVPDLGLAPALRAQGPTVAAEASIFTAGFDAFLQQTLAGLARSDGLDLHLIDSYALVHEAVADPMLFGLTNVTDACLPPRQPDPLRHPGPVSVLGRYPPDRDRPSCSRRGRPCPGAEFSRPPGCWTRAFRGRGPAAAPAGPLDLCARSKVVNRVAVAISAASALRRTPWRCSRRRDLPPPSSTT
jgi:hypothetical protein